MTPDAVPAAVRIERGRRLVLSASLLIGAFLAWSTLEQWLGVDARSPKGSVRALSDLACALLLCYGLYRGWVLCDWLLAAAFTLVGSLLLAAAGMTLVNRLADAPSGQTNWEVGVWDGLHLVGAIYCVWALYLCGDSRLFRRWRRTGEAAILSPPARLERWRVGNR